MASSRSLSRLLLLAVCIALTRFSYADVDTRVEELLALQAKSKASVIELTQDVYEKYLVGPSRPYEVIIWADAFKLRNQGSMNLGGVFKEFQLAASTLQTHSPRGRVFLMRMELSRDRDLFGRFGVVSLPLAIRLPSNFPIPSNGPVQVKKDMALDMAAYPWSAEFFVEAAASSGGFETPQVSRASFLKSRFGPFFMLALFAGMAVLGYRLYHWPFLRSNTWIYIVGTLVVYWFSTSGGMYIIIRKMPFVHYDPRTHESKLFLEGQGQLGAEGYIMGSLYMLVGLIVAGATHLLPRIQDTSQRRMFGYVLLIAAVFVFRNILGTFVWKTRIQTHWY